MRNRIRTGSSPSIQVPPEDAQPLAILRIEFREFQTLPCCLKSKTLELDQSMAKAWRSSAWRKQTLQCLLLQGDTRRFHLDRSYRMFLTYSYFNTEKAPHRSGGPSLFGGSRELPARASQICDYSQAKRPTRNWKERAQRPRSAVPCLLPTGVVQTRHHQMSAMLSSQTGA